MKTIAAFIKDPDTSKRFIAYLVDLVKDLGTGLHMLSIENPANYPMGAQEMTGVAVANLQTTLEARVKETKKQLERTVNELVSRREDQVNIKVSTMVGNEIAMISQLLENNEAHMLAMEYREMSGFWKKDTYVKEMMRNIQCPIWVVPEDAEYRGLHHIIYATDYHREDIPTLQRLIHLTRPFSPKIEALHITDNVDFDEKVKKAGFQKMLETKTGYPDISLTALLERNGYDMTGLINSYASRVQADLIVVLKENKNFMERLFYPSSSEKMVEESDNPILVYHE
jgi:hypothetical protein